MSLRKIFFERVRSRLYVRLKSGKLSDWDVMAVLNFAEAVVKDNMEVISKYLAEKEVTVDNLNESIDELVDKILIPSIRVK